MLALDPHLLLSRQQLLARVSRRDLARALDTGALLRLRRGVYATPAMPEPARRAVAVGGRLTCVSALELAGAFAPTPRALHVQVAPDASRLRTPAGSPSGPGRRRDVILHWTSLHEPGADATVSVGDAIRHLLRCQPREQCIAVLDSALHRAIVDEAGLRELMSSAPRRLGLAFADLDRRSESGIESLVRVGLIGAGLRVEPQVVIPGVGRIDLLVEGRVVVEVDGRQWHHDQQERDYWRDLELARLGYTVVRVDYALAMTRIELVVDAVRRASTRAGTVGVP